LKSKCLLFLHRNGKAPGFVCSTSPCIASRYKNLNFVLSAVMCKRTTWLIGWHIPLTTRQQWVCIPASDDIIVAAIPGLTRAYRMITHFPGPYSFMSSKTNSWYSASICGLFSTPFDRDDKQHHEKWPRESCH